MTTDPRSVPVPRPLRKKKGYGGGLGCLRIFMLPHLLVGIGLIAYVLYLASFVVVAEGVNGTVTGTSSTSDEDGTTYRLAYTFRYEGATYGGESTVSEMLYRRSTQGDIVRVLVHPLFPDWGSRIDEPGEDTWELPFILFFTLFWNGILSVFLWSAYINPVRQRRLISHGAVADGQILKRTVPAGRKETPSIRFRFVPTGTLIAQPGIPIEEEMTIRMSDIEDAQEGRHVTVLFHPAKPSRCIVYEYAPYEVHRG